MSEGRSIPVVNGQFSDGFTADYQVHVYQINSGPVSLWESLGGKLNRAPASSTNGINRLDAFAVGTDNAMYQRTYDGSSWTPPYWAPLGGQTIADPAAVGRGGGIDLLVRGTDSALWWNRFDGSRWLGWQSLGGQIIGGQASHPGTRIALT